MCFLFYLNQKWVQKGVNQSKKAGADGTVPVFSCYSYRKYVIMLLIKIYERNVKSMMIKKEFYIPYAIDVMIREQGVRCDVLSTPAHWFGVTYKEDRPAVVEKFASLAAEGVYPSPLYK